MSLIQVKDLSFAYDGSYDNVFEHLSFQFDTDWKLGLVGRNGRGKTTFLRLLTGQYEYRGSISAPPLIVSFPGPVGHPEWLAGEVMEELGGELPRWRLLREMAALSLEEELLYRPYETLSGGEKTKLQLALLFSREDAYPLIDEPTNHLDLPGRQKVSDYLSRKKGFLLISHDRAFLDGCVDHILSFNKADVELQRGNFSSWWENRQRQDAFERSENEKLKKEIGRLREAAREKADWSDRIERGKIGEHTFDRGYVGHQSARMMQRAKAIENRRQSALEEKEKLLKNAESAAELKIRQSDYRGGRLLNARDLAIDYGAGPLFAPLRFSLETGERLALAGPNGCGKTSLLRLLRGEEVPYTGLLERGGGLRISYVAQETGALAGSLSAYAEQYGVDESLFKALLIKLGFRKTQFETDMAAFSAGQKKKVLIARSLCEDAHLHIWDEPMNYIDVISRMQIEEMLCRFRPTLLFVEHDRAFCDKVATGRLELQ